MWVSYHWDGPCTADGTASSSSSDSQKLSSKLLLSAPLFPGTASALLVAMLIQSQFSQFSFFSWILCDSIHGKSLLASSTCAVLSSHKLYIALSKHCTKPGSWELRGATIGLFFSEGWQNPSFLQSELLTFDIRTMNKTADKLHWFVKKSSPSSCCCGFEQSKNYYLPDRQSEPFYHSMISCFPASTKRDEKRYLKSKCLQWYYSIMKQCERKHLKIQHIWKTER